MGALAKRFLTEEGRRAPDLAAVLGAWRAEAPRLRARGVGGLWVFGSVARGEARPGSAVDLLAGFEQGARGRLEEIRAAAEDILAFAAGFDERASSRAIRASTGRAGRASATWLARRHSGPELRRLRPIAAEDLPALVAAIKAEIAQDDERRAEHRAHDPG